MTAPRDSLRLALLMSPRRFRERPLRTTLTAAGVAAGVALLFSALLLNAQLTDSVRQTGALLTGPALLQVGAASPGGLPETTAADVAADPRVAAAAPVLMDRTTISAGRHKAGTFVVGATPAIATVAPAVMKGMTIRGTLGDGLIVSRSLASELSLEVGQRVGVTTPRGVTSVRVAAVVSSPLLSHVNSGMAAFLPLPDAQQLFGHEGRVDQVMVAAKPGTKLDALEADLAHRLAGRAIVGPPGFSTGASSSDLKAYLLTTSGGGLIALVVAAMLVFNTMTMAMAERRTEIALAGSLGATRRQLLVAALGEAGLLGAVGTAAGLVAGGVLAEALVPLASRTYGPVSPVDIPTHVAVRPMPLLVSAAAGIVVAVVGAFVPARRAARAVPIEALRPAANYEWRDPEHPSRRVAVALAGAVLFAIGTATGFRMGSTSVDPARMGIAIITMFVGLALLLPVGVPLVTGALAELMGRLSPAVGRHAADALRANPRRTSFTVAVLALPLATVVCISAAFSAATAKFNHVARSFITAPLNVSSDSFIGYTAAQPLAPSSQRALEAVPGVRAALAFQNAFIALPDHKDGVVYTLPLTAAQRAGVPGLIQADRLAGDPAAFRQGLAVGDIAASLLAARNLHLHVGSRLTLPTGTGPHTFRVAALFDDWSMRSTFYLDRDTYTGLWHDEGAARFAIVPESGASLAALRSRLEKTVAAEGMAAHVHTRDQDVHELVGTLRILISLTRAIELATLLCAAVALADTAFTAVAERRWTFGLQQALGMTQRQLTRSLALEAVAIGVVGSVAGAAIGLGLGAVMIHAMSAISSSRLPHPIPWGAMGSSLLLGAGIAALATQYPRRTARRLTIIASLRYE